MDLAINNLQRLICNKTQTNKVVYKIAIVSSVQFNTFSDLE